MDTRVQEVQTWLGNTFPAYFYYDENGTNSGTFPVKADGMTGNNTVKALVMALQIHLNLSPIDGIWGNGTSSACPIISQATNNVILLKIVQSGFICKGYNPGPLDGLWGKSTRQAIIDFKEDLGFTNGSPDLSPIYLKSLLTTEPTKTSTLSNGLVRLVQQYLNANYSSLYSAKLGFIPTSGHFERKTSKALIYAFQSVIGTVADGVLGTQSFAKMPVLTQESQSTNIVKILQCALICNEYYVEEINGIFDQTLATLIKKFQNFMCLNFDPQVTLGEVNRRTWGALLRSCGDTDRVPNAADTRFQLTATQAQSLYNDGILYIGRYLTKVANGFDKNLTEEEIFNITNAGIHIIPIFQENNSSIEDFSYQSGYSSWCKAIYAATKLRLPECTIYFSVDFDATEAQTIGVIKDFFQGINDAKTVNSSIYQIGIYSSRNTCSVMGYLHLATNCYVSNMSTAYSGNLGFLMPENWCFDQYATQKNYEASDKSHIDLDKVIASGVDKGISQVSGIGDDNWTLHSLNFDIITQAVDQAVLVSQIIPAIKALEDAYWEFKNTEDFDSYAEECALSILYYLWHRKYDWEFHSLLSSNDSFCQYVDKNSSDLITSLNPYIEKDNYILLKDASATTSSLPGLFELHHLAAVISAYLHRTVSVAKAEWFGWAGDMATAFREIIALREILGDNYVSHIAHARDRICRMEITEEVVQMNYCDFFGDADGFAIYTIIKDLLENHTDEKHIVSSAFKIYYGDLANAASRAHYSKRICYLLNNLPITSYSISEIADALYNYFINFEQKILIEKKGDVNKKNSTHLEIMQKCCLAFAEFIMHYFNSSN